MVLSSSQGKEGRMSITGHATQSSQIRRLSPGPEPLWWRPLSPMTQKLIIAPIWLIPVITAGTESILELISESDGYTAGKVLCPTINMHVFTFRNITFLDDK